MIQTQTISKVADNSGALTAKCIKLLTPRSYASVGDCTIASIRCVRGNTVKKGQISKALITRTKVRRSNHGIRRFSPDNAVVLIDAQGNLKGSRTFGPITRESRARNHRKIIPQSKRMLFPQKYAEVVK